MLEKEEEELKLCAQVAGVFPKKTYHRLKINIGTGAFSRISKMEMSVIMKLGE